MLCSFVIKSKHRMFNSSIDNSIEKFTDYLMNEDSVLEFSITISKAIRKAVCNVKNLFTLINKLDEKFDGNYSSKLFVNENLHAKPLSSKFFCATFSQPKDRAVIAIQFSIDSPSIKASEDVYLNTSDYKNLHSPSEFEKIIYPLLICAKGNGTSVNMKVILENETYDLINSQTLDEFKKKVKTFPKQFSVTCSPNKEPDGLLVHQIFTSMKVCNLINQSTDSMYTVNLKNNDEAIPIKSKSSYSYLLELFKSKENVILEFTNHISLFTSKNLHSPSNFTHVLYPLLMCIKGNEATICLKIVVENVSYSLVNKRSLLDFETKFKNPPKHFSIAGSFSKENSGLLVHEVLTSLKKCNIVNKAKNSEYMIYVMDQGKVEPLKAHSSYSELSVLFKSKKNLVLYFNYLDKGTDSSKPESHTKIVSPEPSASNDLMSNIEVFDSSKLFTSDGHDEKMLDYPFILKKEKTLLDKIDSECPGMPYYVFACLKSSMTIQKVCLSQ